MYNLKRFLFLISIGINIYILAQVSSKEIDRKPPWQPFELNPNLTLKSLVDEGYKFAGMPCRQVQYIKEIGDTIIQYEMEVDCNNYSRNFRGLNIWLEENVYPKAKEIEEDDPFYPFDYQRIKNCYQKINARWYHFKIDKPDREAIQKFVESRSCGVVSETENWNADGSGSFMVYNRKNALYFHCIVAQKDNLNKLKEKPYWQFSISSTIPFLDTERIHSEEERKTKRDEYWDWWQFSN